MGRILLSTAPGTGADDLRVVLERAGFTPRPHVLGSTPGIDFAAYSAAVIAVGPHAAMAAAQTTRWRAELGDDFWPILWVLPGPDSGTTVLGLDSGADVVLPRPLDMTHFVAQVRQAVRSHARAQRVAARASEARLLGEQLNQAYTQIRLETDWAARLNRLNRHVSWPAIGRLRFSVRHETRGRFAVDTFQVCRLGQDTAGFYLARTSGSGALGQLLGAFVQTAIGRAGWGSERGTGPIEPLSPASLLADLNRQLLAQPDFQPAVAVLVGIVSADSGMLTLVRAGLPPPIFLPGPGEPTAEPGEPSPWTFANSWLGIAETAFTDSQRILRPGDRVTFVTVTPAGDDGPEPARPSSPAPVISRISRHRALTGQRFVDAVAADLLALSEDEDENDVTVLCLEFGAGTQDVRGS
jgi:sigma-B regulation protein RsbU (phosphoserine phosphatase)